MDSFTSSTAFPVPPQDRKFSLPASMKMTSSADSPPSSPLGYTEAPAFSPLSPSSPPPQQQQQSPTASRKAAAAAAAATAAASKTAEAPVTTTPTNNNFNVFIGRHQVSVVVLKHQGISGRHPKEAGKFYYQARIRNEYPQRHIWSGWAVSHCFFLFVWIFHPLVPCFSLLILLQQTSLTSFTPACLACLPLFNQYFSRRMVLKKANKTHFGSWRYAESERPHTTSLHLPFPPLLMTYPSPKCLTFSFFLACVNLT